MPDLSLFDLTGRVAVVTGGNGGIGLAMALGLAKAGASVAIVGRKPDKMEAALEAVRKTGANAIPVTADVSNEDDVKRIVEEVVAGLGRLDILVNNAGVTIRKDPQDMALGMWEKVLKSNLTSMFLCSREAYPHMKQQGGGKIINIGSVLGDSGAWRVAGYSVSKGGAVQLTKSLASAWAKDNIQVNCVQPGWIATAMTASIPTLDPQLNNEIFTHLPAGRFGEPEELAGAAVFLASQASSYVTGAVLNVDGGYLLG